MTSNVPCASAATSASASPSFSAGTVQSRAGTIAEARKNPIAEDSGFFVHTKIIMHIAEQYNKVLEVLWFPERACEDDKMAAYMTYHTLEDPRQYPDVLEKQFCMLPEFYQQFPLYHAEDTRMMLYIYDLLQEPETHAAWEKLCIDLHHSVFPSFFHHSLMVRTPYCFGLVPDNVALATPADYNMPVAPLVPLTPVEPLRLVYDDDLPERWSPVFEPLEVKEE